MTAFALLVLVATASPAAEQKLSFAPLFDTNRRFTTKKTFQLRFRATRPGAPIGADEISFSLQRGRDEAATRLPVRVVKPGVFEVPFRPQGPGRYAIRASVQGEPAGSIPPVRVGVVGLAEGMVEVPPEEDSALMKQHRGRSPGKR